eukprot:525383-Alexandrium_andersonii.AAC.1
MAISDICFRLRPDLPFEKFFYFHIVANQDLAPFARCNGHSPLDGADDSSDCDAEFWPFPTNDAFAFGPDKG